MASDFNKPVVGDAYATLLPGVVTTFQDLARGLDPVLTGASTNVPTGAKRWTEATFKWERYNGTTWVDMATSYAISISGSAASVALSGITAATGTATAAHGNNPISWNWAQTTATQVGLNIGETSAAVNGGAGTQVLVKIGTLGSSTADPLQVFAYGSMVQQISASGDFNVTANNGIAGTIGRSVNLTAGTGGSTVGTGGVITITGGTSGAGASPTGGAVTVAGGTTTTSSAGGLLTLRGGNTSSTGTGGGVTIQSGSGSAAHSGAINVLTPDGGAAINGSSGSVNISTGNTSGGTGGTGAISITVGSTSVTTGAVGVLAITGGGSIGSNALTGGAVNITGGASSGTGTKAGGAVTISGGSCAGNATAGATPGGVTIQAGATGVDGQWGASVTIAASNGFQGTAGTNGGSVNITAGNGGGAAPGASGSINLTANGTNAGTNPGKINMYFNASTTSSCLNFATGGVAANGTVATTFSAALAPTGSTGGAIAGWLRIQVAGNPKYIPYWI